MLRERLVHQREVTPRAVELTRLEVKRALRPRAEVWSSVSELDGLPAGDPIDFRIVRVPLPVAGRALPVTA